MITCTYSIAGFKPNNFRLGSPDRYHCERCGLGTRLYINILLAECITIFLPFSSMVKDAMEFIYSTKQNDTRPCPHEGRVWAWHIAIGLLFGSNWGCVSHVPNVIWQGIVLHVTCRSVCNWDQETWSVKIVLDHLILREFKGQNIATAAKFLRKCVDQLMSHS